MKRNTLTELVENLLTSDIGSTGSTGSINFTVVSRDAIKDLEEYLRFCPYSQEILILELARMALADKDIYDIFANQLDISNNELKKLKKILSEITEGEGK